jgi:hypothetical protein
MEMAYESIFKRLEMFAAKRVPGLRDYLRKEHLRDADKLIRDALADKLDEVKKVLNNAKLDRVNEGKLKNLDKIDRSISKLDKVRESIRYASRGYRGLFAVEEVGEKEILALLEFDQKLFEVIDDIAAEAAKVGAAADPELMAAIKALNEKIDAFDLTLGDREKYSTDTLPQK